MSKLLGRDVLADREPFGLKRMTKEDWPDSWPATTTEWAEVSPLPILRDNNLLGVHHRLN